MREKIIVNLAEKNGTSTKEQKVFKRTSVIFIHTINYY